MKNIESTYPAEIDNQLFFSDMRLKDSSTYETYKNYLKTKEYDKGSESLQNSEVDYYGAYVLNIFNRRLRAIGQYLLTKQKPDQVKYQSTEPSNPKVGTTWIS